MCGIVSIIQKDWTKTLNYAAEKAFSVMLFADAVRGTDGTGYFYFNNQKKQVLFQKKGKPSWAAMPEMVDIKKLAGTARWIVGHNRKATMGSGLDSEAHPFIHQDITLVHNGTLSNFFQLKYDLKSNITVDSEVIPHLLMKDSPKKALEKLEGAYALVWHNDLKDRIFYARNKERPLWRVETEDFIALVSEPDLAVWAFARNDITVTHKEEVPVGVIHEMLWNKANKLQVIKTPFTPAEPKNKYYTGAWENSATPVATHAYQQSFWSGESAYMDGGIKRDDVVLFQATKKVQRYTSRSYLGYATKTPEVCIECCPATDLDIEGFYYGKVTSTWMVGKEKHAYVTNVVGAEDLVWSANEILLSEDTIKELDKTKCISCGKQDHEYDDCYIEMDSDNKPHYYCRECSWIEKSTEMNFYAMGTPNNYCTA